MEEFIPVDTGAEAFVALLNANGVGHVFLNPGTDTVPIQEALSKFKALGKRTPEITLCPHEQVAMAAAHGHFMISGKPQVVLVHVDVGTMQVGGALHNAYRGRIGVVFCAGRSPSTFEGEKPGGRNRTVMWWQESFDQAGVVRGYVKWEYELRFNDNIHYVMHRAFQVAASEPCGPVYLTLPRELLVEKIEKVQIPDPARYSPALTPQADTKELARVADLLIQAREPLIIVGYSGRNKNTVASLVELAETVSARVITSDYHMNFPTQHPLCHGINPNPYLKDADVILIIDHDMPYVPSNVRPEPEARIVHIDIDPTKQNMPTWGFPADISLEADSSKAIPVLTRLISQKITSGQRSKFQERLQQLQKEHKQLQSEWRDMAVSQAEQKPISPEWLCHCLAEVIDEDTILLNETVTSSISVARQIPRNTPGTLFGASGSSLGWGLGAALGAKLAAPDKTVVSLVGDGAFMYCCPTAALWAASVHHAPFLCVIFNNGGYNAVRRNLQYLSGEDNFAEKLSQWSGIDFASPPNYALIAQAAHGYGQTVDDPSVLKQALKDALEQVRRGKPAVVDVRIAVR